MFFTPCIELPSSQKAPIASGTAGSVAGKLILEVRVGWSATVEGFLFFFLPKLYPVTLDAILGMRSDSGQNNKGVGEHVRSHFVNSLTDATYRALFI